MDRQMTVQDIRNAKEIYVYDKDILYIVDQADEAYGFRKAGNGWFHKTNFWNYFDSSLMLPYLSIITKEEAVQLYQKWSGRAE